MAGMIGARYDIDGIWRVQSVYVRALCRGQGIGATLVERLVGKLEQVYHAKNIILIVNTTQQVAIHTYLKSGFVVREVLENQESGDGKYYTKFVMCWTRKEEVFYTVSPSKFLFPQNGCTENG